MKTNLYPPALFMAKAAKRTNRCAQRLEDAPERAPYSITANFSPWVLLP